MFKHEMEVNLRAEFDRQVQNLIQKGYAGVAGVEEEEFIKYLEPLKKSICALDIIELDILEGRIPFVIVVRGDWAAPEQAMPLVERNGKRGFTILDANDIHSFKPIESVDVPRNRAYLLVDIDTGKETLNVTPDAALKTIAERNRSPLTIEEGIAVITHYPEVLRKNHGFSLLGSRCGDRRVTALWISEGRPKLGWCWAGNPHTWLGSASCSRRVVP